MIDNLIVGLAWFGLLVVWAFIIYHLGFGVTLIIAGSIVFMNAVLHGAGVNNARQ